MVTSERALSDGHRTNVTNHQMVYERLHASLLSGRIVPGSKVSIAALAEEMKVSAGAVREALSKLEANGLVTSESQRGYRAAPVSEQDLVELVEARIAIEKLCLAEAIKHANSAWEGTILAALHRLSRLHERDGGNTHISPEWALEHSAFHQTIISGCPNAWLRRMHAMLYLQSERYRQLSVPFSEEKRDIQGEHRDLVDALLQRDVDHAQLIITRHLRTTADMLLNSPTLPKQNKRPTRRMVE